MYFPGHIALSYLTSHYLWTSLKVALIAGLFPDVVDKVAYYVLKITPSAHVPAHTLAVLVGTSLLVGLLGVSFGAFWMFAYSWALAYGLHLLFDLLNGKLYLLWPFVDYRFRPHETIWENWSNAVVFWVVVTVIVEVGLSIWAFVVWKKKRLIHRRDTPMKQGKQRFHGAGRGHGEERKTKRFYIHHRGTEYTEEDVKQKVFFLCVLCVSSGAGGENNIRTGSTGLTGSKYRLCRSWTELNIFQKSQVVGCERCGDLNTQTISIVKQSPMG